MRFAEPFNLYFFFLILALAVFLFWSFKMRRLAREKFAQAPLLKELLEEASFFRQKMKSFLLVLAVVFIILALMRPQMGFQWEEIRMKGLDIIVAVDTSKSMLAQDILPSRLERAKLAIRDFIKDINGDRLGLVAFAGSAFLQCPLTVDYGGFLLALDDLTVFSIPKGGTSISSAIEEALKSYKAGEGKYKLSGQKADEYPRIPALENTTSLEMSAEIISNAITKTLFATGNDGVMTPTYPAGDRHVVVRQAVQRLGGGSFRRV